MALHNLLIVLGDQLGPDACPFTTLYRNVLMRHRKRFSKHPRTALQWRNLEHIDAAD